MTTTLNFKDIQTQPDQKPRFKPGIYEGVMVMGVRSGETANGKKVILVNLKGTQGEEFEASWSMEGRAPEYTLRKLKHMLSKVMSSEEAVDAITTVEETSKALTGRTFRFKFIGQEYINKEGQVRVKTDIGLPNFCESMKTPASGSGLTFDPTNQYDMVKLPQEAKESVGNTASAAKSDLPF
jgi:hypothetical protein